MIYKVHDLILADAHTLPVEIEDDTGLEADTSLLMKAGQEMEDVEDVAYVC